MGRGLPGNAWKGFADEEKLDGILDDSRCSPAWHVTREGQGRRQRILGRRSSVSKGTEPGQKAV